MTRPEDTTGEPRWLQLLKKAVAADPSGCTGVATRLVKPDTSTMRRSQTYNRSYVSQAVNGLNKTPVSPQFIQAVLQAYGDGRIDCPHLKTDISKAQCHAHAALSWGQVANTGYERLDQWRACQDCLQNPATQTTTPKRLEAASTTAKRLEAASTTAKRLEADPTALRNSP